MTKRKELSELKGFIVEINTDNAAFDDAPMTEVASILRQLALDCESGKVFDDIYLRDSNGNTCGICNPHATLCRDLI